MFGTSRHLQSCHMARNAKAPAFMPSLCAYLPGAIVLNERNEQGQLVRLADNSSTIVCCPHRTENLLESTTVSLPNFCRCFCIFGPLLSWPRLDSHAPLPELAVKCPGCIFQPELIETRKKVQLRLGSTSKLDLSMLNRLTLSKRTCRVVAQPILFR